MSRVFPPEWYKVIATYEFSILAQIEAPDGHIYYSHGKDRHEINKKVKKERGGGMFVEGKIDKNYLEVLLAAGYEPDWVCNTPEEAAEKGYELELKDDDAIVRIWIDMDTEDFFEPKDLIHENKKLLGLMATCGHKGLAEFAEKELK